MNLGNLFEEPTLPSLIRSFTTCNGLEDVAKNVADGVSFLVSCSIENVEDLLKHMMPTITESMKQIYNNNNAMIKSGSNDISQRIKSNLQMALMLTNSSGEIINYIIKHETIALGLIPSVPVNIAQVLLLTFEHCKSSQKIYQSSLKSVNEIVDLFKKTQEVHSKFLNLLDVCLIFDHSSENDTIIFKNILDITMNISEMLSDVNLKSMADNWKGFVALVQKHSKTIRTDYYLSTAIKILTTEIDKNMLIAYDMGVRDMKKALQTLKINGFLIKVVLKIFEISVNNTENFRDVIRFCLVIYSWHSVFFYANSFPEEFVNTVNNVLYINTASFISQLFFEGDFIKLFCSSEGNNKTLIRYEFGFLSFTNEYLKNVPKLVRENSHNLEDEEIVSLLHLIFNTSKNCYKEFLFDNNSHIYEDLVVNISVTILLFPELYPKMEELLLKYVAQDMVWTALMAMDVWCTVLRHSSIIVRRSTLKFLLTKIQELNIGVFVQTPVIMYLKFLAQRIFKLLPNNIINEEVSVSNPCNNKSLWRILNFKGIPLSQRFHIEFILTDIYDKINTIENGNPSINEIVLLVESMNIISSVAFSNLEINNTRLALSISNLWTFNASPIVALNNFSKYFIHRLSKLSAAVVKDMAVEHLILIMSQLRYLFSSCPLFKICACDIIEAISQKHFTNVPETVTLFSLISDVLQNLLTDKSPLIIQIALETFSDVSSNDGFNSVIHKVSTTSPDIKKLIVNFMRRNSAQLSYNVEFLDKLRCSRYQHRCLEWTDSELPRSKKIKVDDGVDEVISNLKSVSGYLMRCDLNPRQTDEVKFIINQLKKLVE